MSDRNRFPSRRRLVELGWRTLALAGAAGALPRASGAAESSDRILVCIYLIGGNDGDNLVVSLDRAQYDAYVRIRGPLALSTKELLPVRAVTNSGEYGFHPAMGELRDLYNRGVLGVVSNVGSARLAEPRSSHRYDSMAFLPGGYMTPGFAGPGRALTTNRGVSMVPLDGMGAGHDHARLLQAAGAARFRTQFPDTSLGRALKEVASLIQASVTSGIRRPLFTATMGGFDTHGGQAEAQPSLFRELSGAMAALYSATEEMGVARDVTAFTDSEFGRSLRPNAGRGTDHGWGNHQLVMGGSVLGGDIHGKFPEMIAAPSEGGWVPTTSRDEYLATLAGWGGMRWKGAGSLGFMA